jgi:hypothetical protein
MIDEYCVGKDLEGNGGKLIEVLSQHLPGGTEENDGKRLDRHVPTEILTTNLQ